MKKKIYNFSAGPSMLPTEVMLYAQKQFLNWKNTGCSVLEISHRSLDFNTVVEESTKYLRNLLNIPEEYIILFCSGGARGQFSSIPLNLLGNCNKADYIDSGYWSYHAMVEAKKYCTPKHIIVKKKINNKYSIMNMNHWPLSKNSAYMHFCPNETIEGVAIYEEPNFIHRKVIGDFSSCLLSRVIDIKKYDLIYASAQKNIGSSGITIIIAKSNLLGQVHPLIPSIMDYKNIFKNQSMFNTPATFSWYLSSLVLKWMKNMGGVQYFQKLNAKKAKFLYTKIDESDFYINDIDKYNRSQMNITFRLRDCSLNDMFINKSIKFGLKFIKGHKIIGGFRASIYNAMSFSGVRKLVDFMKYFEKRFG
ncbi:Phosphoserine aminotransferase [Buchnera aphidicola (Pterocallis alni)]|uniref:3-phosphoserine/phosphohydroxythreonine transaminase n=1 Tax=Buchnera aphidicola TaxID=9 RepID=UPI003463E3B3